MPCCPSCPCKLKLMTELTLSLRSSSDVSMMDTTTILRSLTGCGVKDTVVLRTYDTSSEVLIRATAAFAWLLHETHGHSLNLFRLEWSRLVSSIAYDSVWHRFSPHMLI